MNTDNLDNGWIKLHRSSLKNGWLRNHKLWAFWSWCLLKATHTEHAQVVGYQQIKLSPGEFIFGREKAAKELNMSEQNIKTCMATLKKLKNITTKPTNKFTVISIVNWDSYQRRDEEDNQQHKQQVTSNSPTTNHKQECKELKNEKNDLKKNNDKGVSSGKKLYPLSFFNYLKMKGKDLDKEEEAKTVQFYLDAYKASRGDEHPHLKAHQWEEAMSTIFNPYDADGDREKFVDFEAMTEIIAKHFQTEYEKGCDYNILHFVSGKIIYLRACECGY